MVGTRIGGPFLLSINDLRAFTNSPNNNTNNSKASPNKRRTFTAFGARRSLGGHLSHTRGGNRGRLTASLNFRSIRTVRSTLGRGRPPTAGTNRKGRGSPSPMGISTIIRTGLGRRESGAFGHLVGTRIGILTGRLKFTS